MWKSKKFIVIAVLIAVVLVGSTAGIALAQAGNDGKAPRQNLLDRVAQILGIDQQKLQDAFKKAMTEQRDVSMDTMLNKLVTDGKITKKQADDFKAWLKAKPDMPAIGRGFLMDKGLDKLVQDGKITQKQLDAYKAWLKAKPDLPLPKPGVDGQRPGKRAPGATPQSTTVVPLPTI